MKQEPVCQVPGSCVEESAIFVRANISVIFSKDLENICLLLISLFLNF